MDYKLINKIIDDVYGEFGSNYENALRDLFYEYDRQKEVLDKALCWISENTHYTDFNVDKLVLDENVNLKELLELLEEIE